MNPVKVMNQTEFSESEISAAFSTLWIRHESDAGKGISVALKIMNCRQRLDRSELEQEASIYCFMYFRKNYCGPVAPPYENGVARGWGDWFFVYAKYAITDFLRKLYTRNRTSKTILFGEMPDWREMATDKAESYDFEKEGKFQKMEFAFDQLPAKHQTVISTMVSVDMMPIRAIRHLGLTKSDNNFAKIKWSLVSLSHRVLINEPRKESAALRNICFGDAVKYAVKQYTEILWAPKQNAEMIIAFAIVVAAMGKAGLAERRLTEITAHDCYRLFKELEGEDYLLPGGQKMKYVDRLRFIFELFEDLSLIKQNPVAGVRFRSNGGRLIDPADPRLVVPNRFNSESARQAAIAGRNCIRQYVIDPSSIRAINNTIFCMDRIETVLHSFPDILVAKREGFDPKKIIGVIAEYTKGLLSTYGGHYWSVSEPHIPTAQELILFARNHEMTLYYQRRTGKSAKKTASGLIAISVDGSQVHYFRNVNDAHKMGFNRSSINLCVAGKVNHCGGYIWLPAESLPQDFDPSSFVSPKLALANSHE